MTSFSLQIVFRAKHEIPVKTIQTSLEDKERTHCLHHSLFSQLTTLKTGSRVHLNLSGSNLYPFSFSIKGLFGVDTLKSPLVHNVAFPVHQWVFMHPEIKAHF